MEVTLVVVQSGGVKQQIPMKRARLLIGRKENCDIRIPLANVSREHCEVKVENGKVIVRDLGSSNGTYVNKERVQEGELAAGSLLSVGPAVFVVQINGKPSNIDPVQAFADGAPPEPAVSGVRPSPAASRPAAPPAAPAKPGPAQPKAPAPKPLDDDSEDSSVSDFDFSDDEDEQPKL